MFHVKHMARLLYFFVCFLIFRVRSVIALRFYYTYITPVDVSPSSRLKQNLNVRAGIFGVFLNELLPRLDFVAHQKCKGFVS